MKQNRVLLPICLETYLLAPESEAHRVRTAAFGRKPRGCEEQGRLLSLLGTFMRRVSLWACVVLKKVSQLWKIPEF